MMWIFEPIHLSTISVTANRTVHICAILYMKPSLWILRLSSRDSNCNCCSNEVTLVLHEYEDSIHLAAVCCIFSSLFESALSVWIPHY